MWPLADSTKSAHCRITHGPNCAIRKHADCPLEGPAGRGGPGKPRAGPSRTPSPWALCRAREARAGVSGPLGHRSALAGVRGARAPRARGRGAGDCPLGVETLPCPASPCPALPSQAVPGSAWPRHALPRRAPPSGPSLAPPGLHHLDLRMRPDTHWKTTLALPCLARPCLAWPGRARRRPAMPGCIISM